MARQNKSVVITGCSSGIGHGLVKKFINEGFTVYGSVRKKGDGARLQKEFGKSFQALYFDVTKEEDIKKAAKAVKKGLNGEKLFALINNAGIVTSGPLVLQPISEIKHTLDVNAIGPILVARHFFELLLPKGGDEKAGRIINVGSISGKFSFPFIGAYVASKHALEGISSVMSMEFQKHKIPVILAGFGFVKTEIVSKGTNPEDYKNSPYYQNMVEGNSFAFAQMESQSLSCEEAAERVYKIYNSANPKLRYAVVYRKFLNWTIPLLLGHKLRNKVISGYFGF